MLKVLIIKTSSMGDIIHALPALTDATKVFPDIQFDWMAEKSFAEVPTWHKSVRKIIPIALRKWRKNPFNKQNQIEWQQFKKTIDAEKYDFVIDAQGLMKSAFLVRYTHGVKCGLDWFSVREKLACLAYDRRVRVNKNQHAITVIRELFAKSLGYPVPESYPESEISLDPHSREDDTSAVCHSRESGNLENPDPRICEDDTNNYLFFAHGTTHPDKFWLEERWIELAKLAAKNGLCVKLPWYGPIEEAVVKRIAAECENVEILPLSNLTTLAKIITESKAVVAVDTGLSHLAAALKVPTVALYGPTDPKLIGAYSKSAIHLQKASKKMADISVDDVWQAVNNYKL
jgi:heptosyltransferase-1